jgi:hypothetical protein
MDKHQAREKGEAEKYASERDLLAKQRRNVSAPGRGLAKHIDAIVPEASTTLALLMFGLASIAQEHEVSPLRA